MNRIARIILFAAFVFGTDLRAMSFLDRSIEELYRDSDRIVVGVVKGIRGECRGKNKCWGYLIKVDVASIRKDPKNHRENELGSICSDIPLEPGRTYTLFLERSESNPVGKIGSCQLTLAVDGAFEEKAGKTYRIHSHQSLVSVELHGEVYLTNAILMPGFEEALATLLKNEVRKSE